MKIGKLVQQVAPAIFAYCEETDPPEFARLQDPTYSKDVFDINYPFCREAARISTQDHVRYYQQPYRVQGQTVRVTSQWFNPPTSKSLPLMRRYLGERGIAVPVDMAPDPLPDNVQAEIALQQEMRTHGRYRQTDIGVVRNAMVRHLLGRLGEERFSAAQWQAVMADFGHRCAYCGTDGPLVMDHVVPINRTSLGEHRLGNLVPACAPCNSAKAHQAADVFLANDPDRLAAIRAHMARHDYVPLSPDTPEAHVLGLAFHEVGQLADRYADILQGLAQHAPEEGSNSLLPRALTDDSRSGGAN